MRLHHIKGSEERVESSPFVIADPESYRGQWSREVFGNDHPLHLEIGCGKGRFLQELAAKHPERNYLGIERMSSVLLRAVEKQEEALLPNLRFLRMNAEELSAVFSPGEIERIYLNFSDPWPKDRHHKRRLTSREFLARYETVLSGEGTVEFKTDNVGLFEFSIPEIEERGWEILEETRDLHHSEYQETNIMTEYEERFAILGKKIMKLTIRPPKESKPIPDDDRKRRKAAEEL